MQLDVIAVEVVSDAPRAASMRRRWLIEGINLPGDQNGCVEAYERAERGNVVVITFHRAMSR